MGVSFFVDIFFVRVAVPRAAKGTFTAREALPVKERFWEQWESYRDLTLGKCEVRALSLV